MIKLSIKLVLLIFIISSCGSKQTRPVSVNDSMTVDLNAIDQKPVPKIVEAPANQIGPAPLGPAPVEVRKKKEESTPRAIILGPGGYRSIGHISFLQELTLKNLRPQVILGHGLSSIIAAYYAFGFAPDFIEWKFFKFINSLGNEDIYSSTWLEKAKRDLLKELKGKRVEEGNLTLIVPVKNRKSGKILFLKRGPLVPLLIANIDHKGIFSKKYEPAFKDRLFARNALKSIGIKELIAVDLLSKGITWVKGSGYLNGIFEKAATVSLKSEQKADIMLNYQLEEFALDDKGSVADLVFKSKELARENVKGLLMENKSDQKE